MLQLMQKTYNEKGKYDPHQKTWWLNNIGGTLSPDNVGAQVGVYE